MPVTSLSSSPINTMTDIQSIEPVISDYNNLTMQVADMTICKETSTLTEPTKSQPQRAQSAPVKQPPIKHAVFGYGSLMSTDSAAKTSKSLADRNPFPCTIRGIERAWNKHSVKGFTAMGVQYDPDATCVGVLYPVNDKELSRFDRREIGYERHEIPIDNVEVIDYLHDDDYYDDAHAEHRLFLAAVAGKREDVKVWVYVPIAPAPPDEDHPIVQTYVDVILQGCLDIHEDFAKEFIEETKGWNPQELLTDDEDDDDDDCNSTSDDDDGNATSGQSTAGDDSEVAWVNDRERPIYMRADTDYSLKEGPALDELLREHRPEFRRRKRLHRKKASKRKSATGPMIPTSTDNY